MAIIIILQRTSERSSVSGMPLKGFLGMSSDTMRRNTERERETATATTTETDTEAGRRCAHLINTFAACLVLGPGIRSWP